MSDVFCEQLSLLGRKERLNNGPWQPAGTLAAAVLKYPRELLGSERPGLVQTLVSELFATPTRDVHRLLTDEGVTLAALKERSRKRMIRQFENYAYEPEPDEWSSWSPPSLSDLPDFVRLALRQFPQVRKIVEAFYASNRESIPDDNSVLISKMIRFGGCTKAEEYFSTTPAGAVLLSALYGEARGGLRLCVRCGGFTVFPRAFPRKQQRFSRKYCDNCRTLSSGRVRDNVSWRKTPLWRRVEGRLRRRGFIFRQRGIDDPEGQRRYEKQMRRALIEAENTPEALEAWEEKWAPKGKPGRPRGS